MPAVAEFARIQTNQQLSELRRIQLPNRCWAGKLSGRLEICRAQGIEARSYAVLSRLFPDAQAMCKSTTLIAAKAWRAFNFLETAKLRTPGLADSLPIIARGLARPVR
jgi:hypothetical protein